jgi:uncharacterized protein (TIGR02757 family)
MKHGALGGELRERLEALHREAALVERVKHDPLELPHRYSRRADVEVAALLSASLAYGRVEGFKPKLELLLKKMGASPARFVEQLNVTGAAEVLQGFVYRFNVGMDLGILLLGMQRLLLEEGTLEGPVARTLATGGGLHEALGAFTRALRSGPRAALRKRLGPERGLDHLLPSPLGPGAAKRLCLFLRWMVRGPDGVDFGLWRGVPPSALVIPLDTHVHRMARNLGLTRRRDLSWRTALEVTEALREVDPEDPVRFDFALCHFGMSGRCPAASELERCARCELLPVCKSGRARVAHRRAC